MLVKGTDVIGLKVLTLQKGKKIEDVDDVVYDPSSNRVTALLIDSGGLFSDAKVILTEDIKSIGEDAVIVDSEKMLKNASEIPQPIASIARGEQYLTRTRVVTEDGKDLGEVSDVYFDPQTGNVEELEVTQGGLRDIQTGRKRVKMSDIITVGEDAMIVKAYTEQKLEKQAERGGLTGVVTEAKEKGKGLVEQAGQRVYKTTAKARRKVEKEGALEQARRKAQEAYDKAQAQLKELEVKTKRGAPKQERGAVNDILQRTYAAYQELDRRFTEFQSQLEKRAQKVWESVAPEVEEAKEEIQKETKKDTGKVTKKAKQQVPKRRRANGEYVIGMYLQKNIKTNGKVFAKKGDVVTHSLIEEAKNQGVLDEILNNVGKER